jgi:hypothetical protein
MTQKGNHRSPLRIAYVCFTCYGLFHAPAPLGDFCCLDCQALDREEDSPGKREEIQERRRWAETHGNCRSPFLRY